MREIEYQEPAVLLGSVKLRVKEFGPTPLENAFAYQDVIERIGRSRASSILVGDFSLFHNPQFIHLLSTGNHLHLEMIVCSPSFSKSGQETAQPTLIDNPSETLLQEIESGFLNPTEGKGASRVVVKAIESGLLNLSVEPKDLTKLCVPNSIIVDGEELFIEQVHQEGKTGKSWYLENPFGLLRRYKGEHSQFREKAKTIKV